MAVDDWADRTYRVQEASGESFLLLNRTTLVTIGRVEPCANDSTKRCATVNLTNSNSARINADPDGVPFEVDANENLFGTWRYETEKGEEVTQTCLISGWVYDNPGSRNDGRAYIFASTYIDDPQGTGGFGGEEDPPP